MKIVVIGGTGMIGKKLVQNLRQQGHDVVAASPSMGVNALTGEGLAQALQGAEVVVDVANSPSFEDQAVLAFFETQGVTIDGEARDFSGVAASGNVMHRAFCPNCGTPLFSRAEVRPHLIGIRVGALDDPSSVTPEAIIWTESAPAWAHLNPELPHVPQQPPPTK